MFAPTSSLKMVSSSLSRGRISSPYLVIARRSLSSSSSPIVELREYQLFPEHAVPYMKHTSEAADLRKSLVPLKLFSLPETGGQLHVATHAYYYAGGHAERDAARSKMGTSDAWKEYLGKCRPCMLSQQSNIFVEAPLVNTVEGVVGLENVKDGGSNTNAANNSDCILELRRYKLRLGYDTVPRFLSLYEGGLPSKLHADGTDSTTSLVSVLYSDVGRLNEVIEIWRHGGGTSAMEQSRKAARNAVEWRSAIAEIAGLAVEFESTIHKPASFSPLK